MALPRPAKTLIALVASMTVGTFVLLLLETDPIQPPIKDLATIVEPEEQIAQAVYDTGGPVHRKQWRSIVVHFLQAPDKDLESRFHFVIYPTPDEIATVKATPRWQHQAPGRRIGPAGGHWNDTSIGICIVGDYAGTNPPRDQYLAALALTQVLQQLCQISPDRVYLASEIDPASPTVGEGFAKLFNDRLLKL